MGLRGIFSYIKENNYFIYDNIKRYEGKTLYIDGYSFLFTIVSNNGKGNLTLPPYKYLNNKFNEIYEYFCKYNIKLVFYWDGNHIYDDKEWEKRRINDINNIKKSFDGRGLIKILFKDIAVRTFMCFHKHCLFDADRDLIQDSKNNECSGIISTDNDFSLFINKDWIPIRNIKDFFYNKTYILTNEERKRMVLNTNPEIIENFLSTHEKENKEIYEWVLPKWSDMITKGFYPSNFLGIYNIKKWFIEYNLWDMIDFKIMEKIYNNYVSLITSEKVYCKITIVEQKLIYNFEINPVNTKYNIMNLDIINYHEKYNLIYFILNFNLYKIYSQEYVYCTFFIKYYNFNNITSIKKLLITFIICWYSIPWKTFNKCISDNIFGFKWLQYARFVTRLLQISKTTNTVDTTKLFDIYIYNSIDEVNIKKPNYYFGKNKKALVLYDYIISKMIVH